MRKKSLKIIIEVKCVRYYYNNNLTTDRKSRRWSSNVKRPVECLPRDLLIFSYRFSVCRTNGIAMNVPKIRTRNIKIKEKNNRNETTDETKHLIQDMY